MKFKRTFLTLLPLLWLSCSALHGAEPSEIAEQHHSALLEEFDPGVPFDRFYRSWLDSGTVEGLEDFLTAQVEAKEEPAHRLILAHFYLRQGDSSKALAQFQSILEQNPEHSSTLFAKAQVEAASANFKAALADLTTALEHETSETRSIPMRKFLGSVHARSGKPQEALETWTALISEHTEDHALRKSVIELMTREGLIDSAITALQQLILAVKDPEVLIIRKIELGDLYQRKGSTADALSTYISILTEVDEGSWLEREIFSQIERVFMANGDTYGAFNYFQTLLTQFPNRSSIKLHFASLSQAIQGIDDTSLSLYREVMNGNPDNRGHREAFAHLLAFDGRHDEALEHFEYLSEANPDDTQLWANLAELHHRMGNPDKAQALVQQILQASQKFTNDYRRCAELLEKLNQSDAARALFQEGVELLRYDQSLVTAYSNFLFRQNDFEGAAALWRNFVKTPDLDTLRLASSTLISQNQPQVAYEILKENFDRFSNDRVYLKDLCDIALSLGQYQEALPWARTLLNTPSISDARTAINLIQLLAIGAEHVPALTTELESIEDPSPQESCLLATLYVSSGRGAEADQLLSAIDTTDPDSVKLVTAHKAFLYRKQNRFDDAIKELQTLTELSPGWGDEYSAQLVELYQILNKPEEALKWIPNWKESVPDFGIDRQKSGIAENTPPWLAEAEILIQMERPEEALQVLAEATNHFDDPTPFLGLLLRLQQFHGLAEGTEHLYWRLYYKAETWEKKLPWLQALIKNSDLQGDRTRLLDALEADRHGSSDSITPLLALAEMYRSTNEIGKWRETLLAAFKMKPNDLELLHEVARRDEGDAEWTKAIATLESALPLDETHHTAAKLAGLRLTNGMELMAFQLLDSPHFSSPKDARTAKAIADSLMTLQEWPRAIRFLEPMLERFSGDYQLQYLYGVALEENLQFVEAQKVFLELLTVDRELPEIETERLFTAVINGHYRRVELDRIRELSPPGTAELLADLTPNNSAYTYNREYRNQNESGFIPLPNSKEEIRGYVFPHLAALARDLNASQREQLYIQLANKGVSHPSIVLADPGNPSLVTEALANWPDDPFLHATWVFQPEKLALLTPEQAVKLFDLFKEEYPAVAVMAALAPYQSLKENVASPLEDRSTLFETLPPKPPLVHFVANLYLRSITETDRLKLPVAVESAMEQTLRRWITETKADERLGIVQYLAMALKHGRKIDEFLLLLQEEQEKFETQEKIEVTTVSHNQGYLSTDSSSFIRFLDINEASPSINSIIKNLLFDPYGATKQDTSLLAKAVQALSHPILRVVAAYHADDLKQSELFLNELLSSTAPPVDAYLMGTVIAEKSGNTSLAVERLQLARDATKDVQLHSLIDRSTVALAIQPEASEELRDAGREAILRLKGSPAVSAMTLEIRAAMETLGIPVEPTPGAQTFQYVNTPLVRGRTFAQSIGRSRRGNRVEESIKRGQLDEAVERSIRLLRRHTSVYLQPENLVTQVNAPQNLNELLNSHGLIEKVIERTDPGPDATFRQQLQFGMVCEMLGDLARAETLYNALFQQRPQEPIVVARQVFLKVDTDPEAAAALWSQLPDETKEAGGNRLYEAAANENDSQKKLNRLRLVIHYLKTLDEPDKLNLQWCVYLIQNIGQHWYSEQGQLAPLYGDIDSYYLNRDQSGMAEIEALRRSTHDELATEMLKIPQLSRPGFAFLTARPLFDGETTFNYEKLAKDALLLSKIHPMGGENFQSLLSSMIPIFAPEDYLAEHVWREGRHEELMGEFIPQLREEGRPDLADAIVQRLNLFTCDEDAFATVARDFINEISQAGSEFTERVTLVINTWKTRALQASLNELFGEVLANYDERYRNQNHPWHRVYANALAENGRDDLFDAFLEQVAAFYLGPKDQREAFIENHARTNENYSSNFNPGRAIRSYQQFISQLMENKKIAFRAIDELLRHRLDRYNNPRYGDFSSTISQLDNYNQLAQYVEHSPFLGNLEEFRVMPANGLAEGSIFGFMMQRVKSYGEAQTEVKQLVQSINPSTFGSSLVLAYLDPNNNRLAEFFGEQKEAISALDEARQAEMMGILRTYYPEPSAITDLSANATLVLENLIAFDEARRGAEIEAFLTAAGHADLIQHGDLFEYTQKLLQYLLKEGQVARAYELFAKHLQVVQDAKANGTWNRGSYANRSDAGVFLSEITGESDYPESTLSFLLKVYSSRPNEESIEIDSTILKSLLDTLTEEYTQSVTAGGNTAFRLLRFKELYAKLAKVVGDSPSAIIGVPLSNLFVGIGDEEMGQFTVWLNDEGGNTTLAKELTIAADLHKIARDPEGQLDSSAVEDHYLAVINDENYPLTWRAAVAESLLTHLAKGVATPTSPSDLSTFTSRSYIERLGHGVPTEFVCRSAALVGASWRALPLPLPKEQTLTLLTAFMNSDNQDSELWKTTAKGLAQDRVKAKTPPYMDENDPDEHRILLIVLTLSLLSEADDSVETIFSQYTPFFSKTPAALMVLLQHGEYDKAMTLLNNGTTNVTDFGGETYTAHLDQRLSEWLKAISSEELALYAEALISSAPDTNHEDERADLSRGERLQKLVEKYETFDFSNDTLEESCILILARSDVASEKVDNRLAQSIEEIDLASISQTSGRNRGTSPHQINLISTHIERSLVVNNIDPYLNFFDEITRESFQKEAVLPLNESLLRGAIANWDDWSREDFVAFIPAINRMFSLPDNSIRQITDWKNYIHLMVAVYAHASDLHGLQAWHNIFPETMHTVIQDQLDITALLQLIASPDAGRQRLAANADFINSLANTPFIQKKLSEFPKVFDMLISHELLSEEMLMETPDAFIEAMPRQGNTAAEIARRFAANNKPDEALVYWNLALSAAEDNDSHYVSFLQGRARSLQASGDVTGALLTAESINDNRIPSELRARYETLLKELRETNGVSTDSVEFVIQQLEANPDLQMGWRALASLYERRGSKAHVKNELQTASAYYKLSLIIRDRLRIKYPTLQLKETESLQNRVTELEIELGQAQPHTMLVDLGAEWLYSDQGIDLGATWRDLDFDDRTWTTGRAKLGYGDECQTYVGYGDNTENRFPTTYFRHHFDLPSSNAAPPAKLIATVLRDDAVVGYLNGTEVFRDNLPDGTITYATYATDSVPRADETRYFEYTVDPSLLRDKGNVIAVEIHQSSPDSTDLGFDLGLKAHYATTKSITESADLDELLVTLDSMEPSLPKSLQDWIKKIDHRQNAD